MPSPASAGLTEVARRPGNDEVDVRQTGPASERASRGSNDVAVGFDICAG